MKVGKVVLVNAWTPYSIYLVLVTEITLNGFGGNFAVVDTKEGKIDVLDALDTALDIVSNRFRSGVPTGFFPWADIKSLVVDPLTIV